ncbi:transcriptional regulator, TetR family [Actinacidiphila yanglinensis]|uniref:Transcriptional regulator, TetR family n=1 Tax=Actinacidiphila yanglinensis TaxID=310779 RepID=A0A1H6DY13_9ACTN|nr:TetR/AcrR family transcriptional regulator [Actinacidiphila yanglinensis]SEG90217.1 transcriptional regulator, TetR family [Actinacidiphila yanglinensis]
MDTAERLIESAQQLLWERGYVGTSPKAIQELAGAGQGSMYHHFKGKPDLAATAMRRSAAELRAQADALLDEGDTALARVGTYLLRERDPLRGCRVGRMAMDPDVIASGTLREPVRDTFAWLRERLAGIVADGVASGELRPGIDPRDTAAALAAVVQGGYVLARAAGDREPFDQAVRGALGLLEAASTGHAAPAAPAGQDG